jgi:hypothetical protein
MGVSNQKKLARTNPLQPGSYDCITDGKKTEANN